MRTKSNRKVFLVFMFIFIIFRTINLPSNNFNGLVSKEKPIKRHFIKYNAHISNAILQKGQFGQEQSVNLDSSNAFMVFAAWKIIFAPPLILILIIIDKRRWIQTIMKSCYEGSRFKDTFSSIIRKVIYF